MTIDDKNIIWLDMFPTLSYNKKKRLLDIFPKGQDIKLSFLSNSQVQGIVTDEEYAKMSKCLDELAFNETLASFESEGIKFVTIYDPLYPQQLNEIADQPLCLYCMGNLQLLNTPCVGVVGSRKPTDYGIVTTKEFCKDLCNAGLTIVSGMAVGVDSLAHKTTLENNGSTIAVLGGGFHHIYPAINHALFRELIQNNLVITEVSPNNHAETFLFRLRNRIIAGLSRAVLVTEAAEQSGSLTTCHYAIKFNRTVFALPGKINAPYSKGCNMLIKQGEAVITLAPDDILTRLNINPEKQKKPAIQLDMKQQIVIDYIQFEKKTFQEIVDYTHIQPSELNSILLEMELDGLVYKLANNSYIMA